MALFQQNNQKNISCVICHLTVSTDFQSEINAMNKSRNYVKCPNEHVTHIEPCLVNWLEHSENCPVCGTKYSDFVLSQFKSIADHKKKEREEREQQERAMEEALMAVEEEQKMEAQNQIADKLSRAEMLMNKERFPPALNILYDVLDNDDPDNLKARFLIGKAHFMNHRFDLAVSNLMKLVKIDFHYPLAFYYIGKSFDKLGLMDKVQWAFERSRNSLEKHISEGNLDEQSIERFKKLIQEINGYLAKL